MLRAAFIVLLIVLLPSHGRAEARIALLIGNQDYDPSVGVLRNPLNDIAVVGQALSGRGFDVLPAIQNAKRTDILGGVRDLVRRLNAAGSGAIGFIYYAAAPPPTQPSGKCDGIEITVGENERRCFKPGAGKIEHFRDCPTCPEMVVVPAGRFTMGSPANEPERGYGENQRQVWVVAPFAVGRFALTFDEWDACVVEGAAATATSRRTRDGVEASALSSTSTGTTPRPTRLALAQDRQSLQATGGG